MCVSGKIKATSSAPGNYTLNQEYPILGLVESGGDVYVFTVDDNSDVKIAGDINGGGAFTITALYGSAQVI